MRYFDKLFSKKYFSQQDNHNDFCIGVNHSNRTICA